jgi:hypothetical protein
MADELDHEGDDLHGPIQHYQGRRQQGRHHGEEEEIAGMAQAAEQPLSHTGARRMGLICRRGRVLRPRHATLLAALLDGRPRHRLGTTGYVLDRLGVRLDTASARPP